MQNFHFSHFVELPPHPQLSPLSYCLKSYFSSTPLLLPLPSVSARHLSDFFQEKRKNTRVLGLAGMELIYPLPSYFLPLRPADEGSDRAAGGGSSQGQFTTVLSGAQRRAGDNGAFALSMLSL